MPKNCWGNTTLAEHHELHTRIRKEIPELLSKLAQEGKEEECLKLLVEWGTHQKKNHMIYNDARKLLQMQEKEIDVLQ